MLRRTAARAFTTLPGRAALEREPAAPRDRREAVDRLFLALQRSFADRIRAEEQRDGDVCREMGRAAEGSPRQRARVSEVRSVLTGVEFVVIGEAAGYRFLNTRRGAISVEESREGRLRRLEVVSVERVESGYRPIRKPSLRRGGYRFDSVRGIAGFYLRAAKGEMAGGERRGKGRGEREARSESAASRMDSGRDPLACGALREAGSSGRD